MCFVCKPKTYMHIDQQCLRQLFKTRYIHRFRASPLELYRLKHKSCHWIWLQRSRSYIDRLLRCFMLLAHNLYILFLLKSTQYKPDTIHFYCIYYIDIYSSYFKEEKNHALKMHCTFQTNSLFFIFIFYIILYFLYLIKIIV